MKGLKFSGLDMKEMKEIIAESNISFPFRHYQRNQERSLSKQAESFEEKLIGMDIEQELLEKREGEPSKLKLTMEEIDNDLEQDLNQEQTLTYEESLDPELAALGFTEEEISLIVDLKEKVGEPNASIRDLVQQPDSQQEQQLKSKDGDISLNEQESELLKEIQARINQQPKPDFQSIHEKPKQKIPTLRRD
ncbi:MAG: hypothetical protein CL760_06230 [Chloroflexi bacterium]|nr:hypothetical protein [Chloroflexota bacterium]|tara:strand:- start:41825 stop:42400 length:576 start_codon:yes stop_codon:yes gene_type:complete